MNRHDLVDLNAFMTVAVEQSFTRAAAKLVTSQSALSHTVRRLETRLGVQLLTRTTRSVSPTAEGERLLSTLTPALGMIDAGIAALSDPSDKPRGMIRIATSEHGAETVLLQILAPFLADNPDIQVDLTIDPHLTDMASDQFDAVVSLGEAMTKDTTVVRIGPELRMAMVGSPTYFDRYQIPTTPRDLAEHNCIRLRRLPGAGLCSWDLEQGDRRISVRVEGQMSCDDTATMVQAAVRGIGLGFLIESSVADLVARGELIRVLEDWCPAFTGYHLCYSIQRSPTPAFALLIDAMTRRS